MISSPPKLKVSVANRASVGDLDQEFESYDKFTLDNIRINGGEKR